MYPDAMAWWEDKKEEVFQKFRKEEEIEEERIPYQDYAMMMERVHKAIGSHPVYDHLRKATDRLIEITKEKGEESIRVRDARIKWANNHLKTVMHVLDIREQLSEKEEALIVELLQHLEEGFQESIDLVTEVQSVVKEKQRERSIELLEIELNSLKTTRSFKQEEKNKE